MLIIRADRSARDRIHRLPHQVAPPPFATPDNSLLLKSNMSTSQVLLISQPRTGCHLLERILTSKQDNARLLAHPAQLSVQPLTKWMESDSYSDGMPRDILVEYQDHIKQGNIIWEQSLQNTKREVCIVLQTPQVVQHNIVC